MPTPRQQLNSALITFYHQPIAKVSLELLLSLGTVIFFAIFAIRPTLLTMSDLIKQIEEKRKLAQDLDKKVAALSSVQSEYLRLQPQLGLLDEAVPSTPQLIYSLKVVERLASDLSLVITGINVPEVPPESTDQASDEAAANSTAPINTQPKRVDLRVQTKVKGDYQQIRQLVENIQAYRRTMIVESVVFAIREEQGARELEATITIQLPYFENTKASSTQKTTK